MVEYPHEQLRLVHDELNRQRSAVTGRHDSMRTRAAILIGGAGVGLTFLANFHSVWLAWTSGILAIVAAGAGVIALLVQGVGDDVIVRKLRDNSLVVDTYSAEWQLVEDKLVALEFDESSLNVKRLAVQFGFALLVLSWIAGVATITLGK